MTTQAFNTILNKQDPAISEVIANELDRQRFQIELIASENFTSLAVLEAQGSVLTNKYAEGYPGRRYYGGCEYVDVAETLAKERACQLFNCKFANVQAHSGSQANQAVFAALLTPGDTILGMSMDAGGHLTHGSKVNLSGKWFNAVSYGVRKDDHRIDMGEVAAQAQEHKPSLIIAGASAYSRTYDFKAFREIADEVGAFLLADIAHYAGLIAGGVFPSPMDHAHVVTTTTHKTLRGPRGGMILTNDADISKKINSAIFPGIQGGPLMHVIAAKAVCFGEALQPSYKLYVQQIIKNAKTLSQTLKNEGLEIVSGGTDCHMVLVDVSPFDITGHEAEKALEHAGITCNKNGIPFDPLPPMKTSGIRLGTPAFTTRGMKEEDFSQIGEWIAHILKNTQQDNFETIAQETRQVVKELCMKFPLYASLG